MTEDQALMEFILARKPGSVLREIAERRLCEVRQNGHSVPINSNTRYIGDKRYYHVIYDLYFKTIREASETIGINKETLRGDMYSERFKYGLIPVVML